jgi:hypothetical protein
MAQFEQNRVSKTVWRWQESREPAKPRRMDPKLKVAISTPIALLIAFGIYKWKGHVVMPSVVVAIALAIGFCGLFVPPAFLAIERFFLRFAGGVATVLNWVLLTPLFFLVFAPTRWLLALRGKDPMHRKCPTDQATYWIPRPPITRENYYRSQH